MLLAHELVARAGIEPSLTGLKDRAPLQKRNARKWWAREGSNFLPSACLADALPMSYAPVPRDGIEPPYAGCRPAALPLSYRGVELSGR